MGLGACPDISERWVVSGPARRAVGRGKGVQVESRTPEVMQGMASHTIPSGTDPRHVPELQNPDSGLKSAPLAKGEYKPHASASQNQRFSAPRPCPLVASRGIADTASCQKEAEFSWDRSGIDVGEEKTAKIASVEKERNIGGRGGRRNI